QSPPVQELPPEYEAETRMAQQEDMVPAPPAPPAGNGNWKDFLFQVESKVPFIYARLSQAPQPQISPEGKVCVTIPECSAFEKKRINGKQNELNSLCQQVMGKALDIRFSAETAKPVSPQGQSREDFKARQAALNHPLAVEAKRIFNGEILI
ncbi:MAG: hypothetical protein MI747_14535, partial [Desulfobacterales bacterium]|nr:hypothetical protein [Desulfobacterales bacterium]